MKKKLLIWALGTVFLLNAMLLWKAVNQDSTFPDYLFKPVNQDNELVEQEPENLASEVLPTPNPEPQQIQKQDTTSKVESENTTEVPVSTNENGEISITVESGQTLAGLARKYKVSVQDIKNANGLTSDVLQLGQLLKIPKSGTTTAPSAQVNQNSMHEVQSGETLNKIAKKYNIDVEKLKQANNLGTDVINVGQKLKIPQ